MSAKTQALIRDLAALVVKYSLQDWAPVITELERRGGSPALTKAVTDLVGSSKPRSIKKVPTRSIKTPRKALQKTPAPLGPLFAFPLSEERRSILAPMMEAIRTRNLYPTAVTLKAAFYESGIKDSYPPRRELAAEMLVRHLDSLTPERFDTVLREIAPHKKVSAVVVGEGGAYERWFGLITKSPKD